MRYRVNERRLELEATGAVVEEIVFAVYSLVVPRYAKKLYFMPDATGSWPKLNALESQGRGFKVIQRDAWPTNLCDRFRVCQDGAALYIIPSDDAKFTKDDLERIAKSLMG